MYFRKIVAGVLCCLAAFSYAASPPTVVTTIPPIQAIAEAMMQDVAKPVLLLPPGSSPHTLSLKPSQVAALENADLIIWVGPELETPLKPIVAKKDPEQIMTLTQMPYMSRYFMRDDSAFTPHAYTHEHGESEGAPFHEHIDPHMWLDPMNMIVLTQRLSNHLKKIDPDNASVYQRNEQALTEALTQLRDAVQTKLNPVKNKPFMVYHDGFQYFEKRFDLNNAGTITSSPETPASAAKMLAIKRTLKDDGIVCIFSEAQFSPAVIEQLGRTYQVHTAMLDPLGNTDLHGYQAYETLITQLADNMVACLSQ